MPAKLPSLSALLLGVLLAGCAGMQMQEAARAANEEAAANGSPFRWEARDTKDGTVLRRVLVDLPVGPTSADAQLQADILAVIAKSERTQNRPAPRVLQVRLLPNRREIWVVASATPDEGLAYIVLMRPSSRGGTDIMVNGPTPFTLGARAK